MPSGYNWCLLVARWSIRDRRVPFIIRSLTSCGFHSSWDRVSNRICGNTAGKLCAVNCVRRFRPFCVVCMYCGISQGILASSQSEDMQKKMKMGGWINDHLKNDTVQSCCGYWCCKVCLPRSILQLGIHVFVGNTCMPQTQISRVETKTCNKHDLHHHNYVGPVSSLQLTNHVVSAFC